MDSGHQNRREFTPANCDPRMTAWRFAVVCRNKEALKTLWNARIVGLRALLRSGKSALRDKFGFYLSIPIVLDGNPN